MSMCPVSAGISVHVSDLLTKLLLIVIENDAKGSVNVFFRPLFWAQPSFVIEIPHNCCKFKLTTAAFLCKGPIKLN